MKVAKLSVAYVKSEEQLESAESQLAACRTALKEKDCALRAVGEYLSAYRATPRDVLATIERALGGPDDAPKEPTRCKNPLCRNGTVPDPDDEYGSGNGPYFRVPCPSCGSLPERDR